MPCCCTPQFNPSLKENCGASKSWSAINAAVTMKSHHYSFQVSVHHRQPHTIICISGLLLQCFCIKTYRTSVTHTNVDQSSDVVQSEYVCTFMCSCAMNLISNWQMAPSHKALPQPSWSPHILISVMEACHSSVGWSLKLATVRIWLYSSSRGMCIDFKPLEIHWSAKWP